MVGSHVVEDGQIVWLDLNVVDDVLRHLRGVSHLGVKLASIGRHHAIEIHVVLSEGPSLVKAAELDDAACNDLVLGDAEDLLLVEPLQGVDDAERHAHGQRWRDRNEDDVDQLDDQV